MDDREPLAAAELLQRLIRFDTANPPGDEAECIAWCAELARAAGGEVRIVALDDGRPNLVARTRGRGEAAPLLLYGHVDVVGAGPAAWRHPPFGGELEERCRDVPPRVPPCG